MLGQQLIIDEYSEDLISHVLGHKVGGTYWASQPDLPSDYLLVRTPKAARHAENLGASRIVVWQPSAGPIPVLPDCVVIRDECDPWHMLSSAVAVIVEAGDEVRLIASILGVRCFLYDPVSDDIEVDRSDSRLLLREALLRTVFADPFTGEPITASRAVALCGFWRQLIDSNRNIDGGLGFAFWKQDQVAALLWDGSRPFRFIRNSSDCRPSHPVAVWRSKLSQRTVSELERRGVPLIEIEDGFLRSRGLGADCVPPLSLTLDRMGVHFDPGAPSELEQLLEEGDFNPQILARARELRHVIVREGIGKYEKGLAALERPAGERLHILVVGQVEDDRSILIGGCGLVSNLELLRRVRRDNLDAHIIYKPHPDVLAGHRTGAIGHRKCLEVADEIIDDAPMASLIGVADEVHVNTSLAGFEALLRGKLVTTYGIPFYAGWGLTRDLGPVPQRRTKRRTLDELVAATLLIYPRYLDPVSGLPCPAEVVVSRLSAEGHVQNSPIVRMRRLQGKIMRRFRSLVQ